ncbi:MAG: hypothetical protein RBT75_09195 [Anaerolineae bacterium]|jgi:hypothetical protein|nr:hypothetical protein [Anaerolineae bacterium]
MVKSGLIFGAVMLVAALGATLISPLCVSCLAIFVGLGAGYVAGVFDKPLVNQAALKSGALAGLIAGIGGFIGQAIGTVINASTMGPDQVMELLRQLGIDASQMGGATVGYWGGLIGSALCGGTVAILLTAGLGAVGGILWWQMTGKNRNTNPPAYNQQV